tara:strand:- start:114 stop:512 length:399 start_codon:yes stop_codon:yes gene_type:complete
MSSRHGRLMLQDFAYRYIQENGGQTTIEILDAYKDSGRGLIAVCNNRELSVNLSKSRLFFREKVHRTGRQGNLNRWFTNDVKVIAKKLAGLTHMQSQPKLFPKILRDEYYACVAERQGLKEQANSEGIQGDE